MQVNHKVAKNYGTPKDGYRMKFGGVYYCFLRGDHTSKALGLVHFQNKHFAHYAISTHTRNRYLYLKWENWISFLIKNILVYLKL